MPGQVAAGLEVHDVREPVSGHPVVGVLAAGLVAGVADHGAIAENVRAVVLSDAEYVHEGDVLVVDGMV
ncbi:hypothetical protein GCM10022206_26740 [Streptomyces chiangmaiensis]